MIVIHTTTTTNNNSSNSNTNDNDNDKDDDNEQQQPEGGQPGGLGRQGREADRGGVTLVFEVMWFI